MKQVIHRGYHRPRLWFLYLFPWIGYNRKSISREITFSMNCLYDLPGIEDDLDVNKLFGLGYLWDQKDSVRFGWNYNITMNRIAVFMYYHVDGRPSFKKICDVVMGLKYLMTLNIGLVSYTFSVFNVRSETLVGREELPKSHKKKWSYNQGLYFGGNQVAPNDLTIEIKKL